MHDIQSSVETIKGVGAAISKKYKKLGVKNIEDLLYHFPRRYDDYSNIRPISRLKPGKVSIHAKITHVKGIYVRGGLHITEAIAQDASGSVRVVWFNQPYRQQAIKKNTLYFMSGQFDLKRGRLALTNPSIELASSFPVNTARIVPIYPETSGLTSIQIRKNLKTVFSDGFTIDEFLPLSVIKHQNLLLKNEALFKKHFPDSAADITKANERLGFEELFELILSALFSRAAIENYTSVNIPFEERLAKDFVRHLPFMLTDAQRKSIWQIYMDMQKTKPMNRLLEGDVGSGKTVVAAMASAMVIRAGYQVAFMAPTEILARQHAETMHTILRPLGFEKQISLLLGSTQPKARTEIYDNIQSKKISLLIGTHALFHEKVSFPKLGLVVIDEQHRFGVEQRKHLLAKAGYMPHMLSMTATPIPRSLALTVFGEVDISLLDQKPKSRQSVKTELINPTDRLKVYEHIKKELDRGQQMFVVCPLIEDNGTTTMKSAKTTYQELIKNDFKQYRIGLLHGKMPTDEKQRLMQEFIGHKLDILVTTTVIEVGVDVPNANIMMIESPERFGLAQLHQLRGRIGRGSEQGHCYLMLRDSTGVSKRLNAISSTDDGFKLAELDLSLRGAGALYGVNQHGLLDLRIANFTDRQLIARARLAAKQLIQNDKNLIQYPHIKKRILELQHVVHLN